LREVKKKYGTNSLRIEFEGNGEFLKSSSLVKRADVYQNYAELELVDIRKSRELLSSIDDRLNIRKFEIVEPSLNSIFINVVGMPATPEEVPAPKTAPATATKQPLDKRLKKELFSLSVGAAIFVFSSIYMLLFAKNPDLLLPGMFLLITLFSTFRFMKMKKTVENERKKLEGGAIE
jgi:hypothetical protein